MRLGFDTRHQLVHSQPLVFLCNVVHWDANIQSQVELGHGFVGPSLPLHLADRPVEHLGVQLEADGLDVAALLSAQQVSGAPKFQIEGRNLEAGAQVGKFLQRGETAAGHRSQLDFPRHQEIGVGAAVRSADAAAQLIELRKPETLGAADEDGVAEWDIEAVFDDGSGDENVGFVMHEFEHHFLQFPFRHLTVAYDDARPGHEFLQLGGDFPNGVHAVVHKIDLAAALEFLLEGRLDQLVVPAGDHGLDGDAVFGRRLDDAHIAQANHRHVQGARDGGRRHGEDIHLLAHPLDPLFVAHSKALLFVHHQKPEVRELHVLGEQAVRADQNIHLAGFGLLENFLLLPGSAEAADHFDGHRKRGEALLEGFEVLKSEDRRGRKHRDLFVIADRLERRAHGNFRLAVAHVAAEQAVHGVRRLHVALHVSNGQILVSGFGVFEGILKLSHPFIFGGKSVAFGRLPLGVELDQLLAHILHGLADAGFRLGPCRRPQMIESRPGALGRPVFLDEVEAGERYIKPRPLGVFEQHEFRVAIALVDFLQTLVLANTVLDVHHVVAHLQVAEVGEESRSL